MEYGADVNHQKKSGSTALFDCFYEGQIECLKELLKFKPDASIVHKPDGMYPVEAVFHKDNHEILDFVLNN